ncbi:MAG TPA: 2-oxo-4-hydroxy-4-carboxy-5-ureidoimidazoline decarboxylase [Pyrinomonadaceae bacterium]|nr:2-oxo-4-hydroxy-4-carboxy-5-ureidoimidazoline decarboxylase [Pyrinomonadaceae bacterium]
MQNLPNGLRRLNVLQPPEAVPEFLKCCGSPGWARQMSEQLPFRYEGDLFASAEQIWWNLSAEDWLEAFRSHPKIGEQKAAAQTSAASLSWSSKEQSGLADATSHTRELLAELNRRYEEKFGFIYIVCATGKSSDELLTILQQRLANDSETELRIAAGEQAKITELRLHKLLADLEQA